MTTTTKKKTANNHYLIKNIHALTSTHHRVVQCRHTRPGHSALLLQQVLQWLWEEVVEKKNIGREDMRERERERERETRDKRHIVSGLSKIFCETDSMQLKR